MIVIIGQYGGIAAAFEFGGVLFAAFGTRDESWRWSIVVMTVPLIIMGLWMFALRDPPRAESYTTIQRRGRCLLNYGGFDLCWHRYWPDKSSWKLRCKAHWYGRLPRCRAHFSCLRIVQGRSYRLASC